MKMMKEKTLNREDRWKENIENDNLFNSVHNDGTRR